MTKTKTITELTMPDDQKAEMALIVLLHRKDRAEKRRICTEFGCEWEEYQRLLRKYRQIIERWERKEVRTNENCKRLSR